MEQNEGEIRDTEHDCGVGWENMSPDVLVNIFLRLDLKNALNTYAVCSKWANAVGSVWSQNIDLMSFQRFNRLYGKHEEAAQILLKRAGGKTARFCIHGLRNADMLLDDTTSAPHMKELIIPNNYLTDEIACEIATKFIFITCLDFTGAKKMGITSVESFAKNCKQLKVLKLSGYVSLRDELAIPWSSLDWSLELDEYHEILFCITKHMPHIEELQFRKARFYCNALKTLLEKCPNLKHLDLSGSLCGNIEEGFLKEAAERLEYFHPKDSSCYLDYHSYEDNDDYYDYNDYNDYNDYHESVEDDCYDDYNDYDECWPNDNLDWTVLS